MGLDMYMVGEEDGREVPLAYWRKHPDLHGFIVKKLADGVDECQKIPLSCGDLIDIFHAVDEEKLPRTTGFFFGLSYPEDREPTMELLQKAIIWLQTKPETRKVYYQASW